MQRSREFIPKAKSTSLLLLHHKLSTVYISTTIQSLVERMKGEASTRLEVRSPCLSCIVLCICRSMQSIILRFLPSMRDADAFASVLGVMFLRPMRAGPFCSFFVVWSITTPKGIIIVHEIICIAVTVS
jgi:hypothetical protein